MSSIISQRQSRGARKISWIQLASFWKERKGYNWDFQCEEYVGVQLFVATLDCSIPCCCQWPPLALLQRKLAGITRTSLSLCLGQFHYKNNLLVIKSWGMVIGEIISWGMPYPASILILRLNGWRRKQRHREGTYLKNNWRFCQKITFWGIMVVELYLMWYAIVGVRRVLMMTIKLYDSQLHHWFQSISLFSPYFLTRLKAGQVKCPAVPIVFSIYQLEFTEVSWNTSFPEIAIQWT